MMKSGVLLARVARPMAAGLLIISLSVGALLATLVVSHRRIAAARQATPKLVRLPPIAAKLIPVPQKKYVLVSGTQRLGWLAPGISAIERLPPVLTEEDVLQMVPAERPPRQPRNERRATIPKPQPELKKTSQETQANRVRETTLAAKTPKQKSIATIELEPSTQPSRAALGAPIAIAEHDVDATLAPSSERSSQVPQRLALEEVHSVPQVGKSADQPSISSLAQGPLPVEMRCSPLPPVSSEQLVSTERSVEFRRPSHLIAGPDLNSALGSRTVGWDSRPDSTARETHPTADPRSYTARSEPAHAAGLTDEHNAQFGSHHAERDGDHANSPPANDAVARQNLQALLAPTTELVQNDIRQAMALANRGAIYSARQRLEYALQEIADAIDSQQQTQSHREHLGAGLLAMREAPDFMPPTGGTSSQIQLETIKARHRSSILGSQESTTVTAADAMQRYYQFATDELTAATGGIPVASEALYALGKLSMIQAEQSTAGKRAQLLAAAALFRASLRVNDRMYLAANELAVLMAREGKLEAARELLQISLAVQPLPVMWHNLAVVHSRLGETQLAERSQAQAKLATARHNPTGAQRITAANGSSVYWVDKSTFENGSLGVQR